MDLGIAKRTALVLGGGGGLGSAICRGLAEEGVHVIVADLNPSRSAEVVEHIRRDGGAGTAVSWDLADLDAMREVLTSLASEGLVIDILVNISGGPPPAAIDDIDSSQWTGEFARMALPIMEVTKFVLPGMMERGWGRVITSTSSGVVAPIDNLGISNSLRMVLVGWSKTLSTEVAKRGVTCNVLVPGRIRTARVESLDSARAARTGLSVDEVSESSQATIPIGRYGEPSEYAAAAVFLASERASYITGAMLRVDGGLIRAV